MIKSNMLNLIANPGSASRKYALYQNEKLKANLHFEWEEDGIICTLRYASKKKVIKTDAASLTDCAKYALRILKDNDVLKEGEVINKIGLRVVAPSKFFLEDRLVDDHFISRLEAVRSQAPIHVTATLDEMSHLKKYFKNIDIVGISDSAFHKTKPDYAWNYGLSPEITDKHEIKRYGYHGISIASVVRKMKDENILPSKVIICHLGSGASITAVKDGKSVDNTMGYSPLEGVIMSTRCGTIDFTAARVLKQAKGLNDSELELYLNKSSGLLGLGGHSDIRELLIREETGGNRAKLALNTYVYSAQKSIAHMAAALNGTDAIVFTGTVGERSMPMRKRILANLTYLGFSLDDNLNDNCDTPKNIDTIHKKPSSPIYVISTKEVDEMAKRII